MTALVIIAGAGCYLALCSAIGRRLAAAPAPSKGAAPQPRAEGGAGGVAGLRAHVPGTAGPGPAAPPVNETTPLGGNPSGAVGAAATARKQV